MSGNHLKVLVACGSAAGIAATFNAPIAGVFCAQEIGLVSSFEVSSFTAIVIASGMSTVVSRALLGAGPVLIVPSYAAGAPWELALYVLLGIIVGGAAAVFIGLHLRILDAFHDSRIARLARPVVGGGHRRTRRASYGRAAIRYFAPVDICAHARSVSRSSS